MSILFNYAIDIQAKIGAVKLNFSAIYSHLLRKKNQRDDKMPDIDYIMSLLDRNKSPTEQSEGIEMAKNIECINVFIQPCGHIFNKNVWDNCAKILSLRSDDELYPYLIELFLWLRDLNWRGALCILARLQGYEKNISFIRLLNSCITCARALNDEVWESNLQILQE